MLMDQTKISKYSESDKDKNLKQKFYKKNNKNEENGKEVNNNQNNNLNINPLINTARISLDNLKSYDQLNKSKLDEVEVKRILMPIIDKLYDLKKEVNKMKTYTSDNYMKKDKKLNEKEINNLYNFHEKFISEKEVLDNLTSYLNTQNKKTDFCEDEIYQTLSQLIIHFQRH